MRLILASASPARKKLLEDSGISFDIQVSSVDEDAALASAQEAADTLLSPSETALVLARAKAEDLAGKQEIQDAYILGCDSVFEFEGSAYGKPHTVEKALERISAMSGKSGVLHTGHWLIKKEAGKVSSTSALRSARVHFAAMSDQEISAYIATEEPLYVAGSFTIDGFGAAFIKGIEGEHHTVVGLSINALKDMLKDLDDSIVNFWVKTH